MDTIELVAEIRTITGKASGSLRRKGILPAVLYGAGTESQSISVLEKDFRKVFIKAGESSLVTLKVGVKDFNVLIHDVLLDPLTERPLHADFLAVRMDKEIRTKIDLEFIGESPAVKNDSGVLVKVMHEVEISALPSDLPHSIPVLLSKLANLNDRLTVNDLEVPKGVRIMAENDEVVALVEPPRTEEELKALETTEPAATVEVETEREVKQKAEAEVKAAEETE